MALDTTKAQEALVSLLTVGGVCDGRVYDFIPASPSNARGAKGQQYPFCVLDDLRVEEDDIGHEARNLLYQVIQVWSEGGGKAEVQTITDQIKGLLHLQKEALSDGDSLRIVWETTQLFNERDARAYRGVMRFRIHHETGI